MSLIHSIKESGEKKSLKWEGVKYFYYKYLSTFLLQFSGEICC